MGLRLSRHPNGADADDIVQESFLRLLRSGPDAGDEARRRFLYRVASNLIVDRWRRRKREDPESRPHLSDVVAPPPTPDHDVARIIAGLAATIVLLVWAAPTVGRLLIEPLLALLG